MNPDAGERGLIFYFFNLEMMARAWPEILSGFWLTLLMAGLTVTGGLALGLALAVLRAFQIRPVTWAIVFMVDVFRAIPALVIIVVMFFALPYAGINFSPFWATTLSLILVLASFSEEVFWAGITAVDRGQWEAARSTGLTFLETLRFVIMPQAVRLAIPPLTNWTIAITKSTALGSFVAVPEMLSQASSAQSTLANPSPLTLASAMFLVIFVPLVMLTRFVERRYGWKR
jgi:polar amino acid transport system permease protein